MQADPHAPQYSVNGGLLQNGYQLQHYRHVSSGMTDGLARQALWFRSTDDASFEITAQHAQQMLLDQRYKRHMKYMNKQPDFEPTFGTPKPPDFTALVATGSRDYAIAMIEQYLQQYAAWMQRSDAGGLRAEKMLELVDRSHTKAMRKRRKKEQAACVMQ
ncbi:hypothetical protein LTR85_011168 [Meristemomyces frigidus]|nr:hypothetical protein LTR85_011168 [Meristemomyces frigidus]